MTATINTQHVAGEDFLNLGTVVLVKSQSKPGAWYAIQDGRCTCPGYGYRGTCRHLAAAEQLRAQARADAPHWEEDDVDTR
jgi:SWIM zinc finger